jgi:hypothetical protein
MASKTICPSEVAERFEVIGKSDKLETWGGGFVPAPDR